ncbi:MAG: hypothetical protein ACOYMF_08600 [Bacteroidales bacterium]
MDINRENYEIYFLDYHEGRLGPGDVAELLIFLEANAEFKDEFENYEIILVAPDISVSFDGKASLKKNDVPATGPIKISNCETYFIADSEGLLTPAEQKQLSAFFKLHPELKADYQLYQKLHLQPDLNITFPSKARLKRSILSSHSFYYYSLAAAASLALLLSVFMNPGTRHASELAETKEPTIKTSSTISPKTPEISKAEQSNLAPAKNTVIVSDSQKTAAISQALAIAETHSQERAPVNRISAVPCAAIISRDLVELKYTFIRQSKQKPATFSNLYDQLNLADRMKNDPVLAPIASSPKNVLRSGFKKLGNIFTGKEAPAESNTINFWTLADLGISGYNLLTDKGLRLLTQSNEKGKVMAYALKGDEFEYTRKRNK